MSHVSEFLLECSSQATPRSRIPLPQDSVQKVDELCSPISRGSAESQQQSAPRPGSSASTLVACSPPSSPYQSQVPRLMGSFTLDDKQQWDISEADQSTLDRLSIEKQRGHQATLLGVLEGWGWLMALEPGCSRHIPALITFALEIFVIATTLRGGYSGLPATTELSVIHWYDSASRQVLVFMAHFAMYFCGGRDLTKACRQPEFTLPFALFSALAFLTALEFAIDICVFANRFSNDAAWGGSLNGINVARRICISITRLPSAASLIVMMSVPTNLCQDLVRVVIALDNEDTVESFRLYSIFWRRLRIARRWYNYIMTPHFLIALFHLPIAAYLFFMIRARDTVDWTNYEVWFLVAYTVVDVLQMVCWIYPAMTIRSNHAVALVAAVGQAGLPTSSGVARELATMMASLHPIVGLKFLGAIITWRLVAAVATIASALLGILKWRFKIGL